MGRTENFIMQMAYGSKKLFYKNFWFINEKFDFLVKVPPGREVLWFFSRKYDSHSNHFSWGLYGTLSNSVYSVSTIHILISGENVENVWYTTIIAFGREYAFSLAGIECCQPVSAQWVESAISRDLSKILHFKLSPDLPYLKSLVS